MYVQEHFREEREETLHEFIRAFPFATLVTSAPAGPEATHIPLVLDATSGGCVLRGHMARANPHWRYLGEGADALAIFLGPHAYVSPQWYPSKQTDGKVVPTWNYAAVHAHGSLRAVSDKAWLLANVTALTQQQEGAFAEPWAVSDAPADYVDKMLGAIVGVELVVTRLEGKWKLSQNRTGVDRDGARVGLAARDGASAAVAAMMPPSET